MDHYLLLGVHETSTDLYFDEGRMVTYHKVYLSALLFQILNQNDFYPFITYHMCFAIVLYLINIGLKKMYRKNINFTLTDEYTVL